MTRSRKWSILLGALLIFIGMFIQKERILLLASHFLIKNDSIKKTKVAFVFSGDVFSHSDFVSELYHTKMIETIVCISKPLGALPKLIDCNITLEELLKEPYQNYNVPDSVIELLIVKTQLEGKIVSSLDYCKEKELDNCLIVCNDFTSRRIHMLYNYYSKDYKTTPIIISYPDRYYKPEEWWNSEDGLLKVSQEYVKLMNQWRKLYL